MRDDETISDVNNAAYVQIMIMIALRARIIATKSKSIVSDDDVNQLKISMEFISNMIKNETSIRNLINTTVSKDGLHDFCVHIYRILQWCSDRNNAPSIDIHECTKYIDSVVNTLYLIQRKIMKEKCNIDDNCDISIDHALVHLDNITNIITEEDTVTSKTNSTNIDVEQLVHDTQTCRRILNVLKDIR
mgnify:CR=1 FL=1